MKRPASAVVPVPDHVPPERAPHGSVGELIASLRAELARKDAELAACKRELRAWQAAAEGMRLPMILLLQQLETEGTR